MEAVHRVGGQHKVTSYPAILLKMPKIQQGFSKIHAQFKAVPAEPLTASHCSALLKRLGVVAVNPSCVANHIKNSFEPG